MKTNQPPTQLSTRIQGISNNLLSQVRHHEISCFSNLMLSFLVVLTVVSSGIYRWAGQLCRVWLPLRRLEFWNSSAGLFLHPTPLPRMAPAMACPNFTVTSLPKNGNDVYRYPSPLHAVAVQSPILFQSMTSHLKDDCNFSKPGEALSDEQKPEQVVGNHIHLGMPLKHSQTKNWIIISLGYFRGGHNPWGPQTQNKASTLTLQVHFKAG